MTVASAVGSFALVAALITIIPGLDTTMVLRATLARGTRQGFLTALGIGSGALVWGIAAAVGISALLTASTVAYTALRIVGAAYMIWLGSRMFRTALSNRPLRDADRDLQAADRDLRPADRDLQGVDVARLSAPTPVLVGWRSGSRSWRQGLFTNLLNPKIGAFYLSVLPQFIPANTSPLLMGLLLAAVHDLEGMIWFTFIILGTHRIRSWLQHRSVARALDGLTGGVLIGFGLKLGSSAN